MAFDVLPPRRELPLDERHIIHTSVTDKDMPDCDVADDQREQDEQDMPIRLGHVAVGAQFRSLNKPELAQKAQLQHLHRIDELD